MLESFFSTPRLKCQGTFIEMGALDGSELSNSWFFEEILDWRGKWMRRTNEKRELRVENSLTYIALGFAQVS
jgi:hypothetical protein